jgi:hypothetical protein
MFLRLLRLLLLSQSARASLLLRVVNDTTRYPLGDSAFVQVGWTGEAAACSEAAGTYSPLETHGCRDDVQLTYCPSEAEAAARRSRPQRFSVCVPPLYGQVNPDKLSQWLRWYARLGVKTFFVYAINAEPPPGLHTVGVRVFWLRADWLTDKRAWKRGQLWAAHDCLYRARSRGLAWTLFLDVDEYLYTPLPLPDVVQYLTSQNVSAGTFGKKDYAAYGCSDAAPDTWQERAPALVPYCYYIVVALGRRSTI